MTCHKLKKVEEVYHFLDATLNSWINIDGLRKQNIDNVCNHFVIHPLIAEDILSIGQRPKTDEIDGLMYCLFNMLSFNEKIAGIETEQVSIVLGKNFVISFQEDPFNPLREKLKIASSKVRQNNSDFLFYSLLDYIVDH